MMPPPTVLLVDGFNLLWRGAFGFPVRTTSRSGIDVTPIFGFFALLRKAINELGIDVECVVCFEGEYGHNDRLIIDPKYKQNRADGDYWPLAWLPDVGGGLGSPHTPDLPLSAPVGYTAPQGTRPKG